MPKYRSPEAAESFREAVARKVQERVQYCAEHVEEVVPGARDEPLPKRDVFNMADSSAKANGLNDHPYFGTDPSRFRRYLETHWGGAAGIVSAMEEDGVFLERGTGIPGIRRAGKVGLRRQASWSAKVCGGTAETHNRTVENARPLVALPAIQMKLLLPASE
jgi:hypothetical protein